MEQGLLHETVHSHVINPATTIANGNPNLYSASLTLSLAVDANRAFVCWHFPVFWKTRFLVPKVATKLTSKEIDVSHTERPFTLTEAFKDEDSKIRAFALGHVKWALQELSKNTAQKSQKEYSISLHSSNPVNSLHIWPRQILSNHCYFDFGRANLNSAVTDLPCHSKSKVLVKRDEPS